MQPTVDLEQFAVEMLSFEKETIKLCRDYREGRVFKTAEFELSEADEDHIIEASCLKDIPDISFFTMGPVYVVAQVPYSFLDQFTGEAERLQFITFDTGVNVADGLDVVEDGVIVGTWDNKLQAVGSEHLDDVTAFMCSQVLGRDGKIFGITHQDAMIQDPVLKAKHGVSDDNLLRVRLFLPYTQRGQIVPHIDLRSGEINFTTKPTSASLRIRLQAVAKAQSEGTLSG